MADFIFATACSRPRVKDSPAAQAVINRYCFDEDLEVRVEEDPADNQQHLALYGYGWPGAWAIPEDVNRADFVPDCDVDGMDGFEQFLRDVAPHLAEPLTVHCVGFVNCRFPLSACEWHILPNSDQIEVNDFHYCRAEEPMALSSQ